MPVKSRKDLYKLFKDGSTPNQNDFKDLIDSALNKMDDDIEVDSNEGLSLSPMGKSNRLISFFSRLSAQSPIWSIAMEPEQEGLSFSEDKEEGESRLFIKKGGNVGIGTTNPSTNLDVNGTVRMESRLGSKFHGTVPGDGNWHRLTPDLNGCYAFEVMLKIFGTKGKGQYAMAHAIAISTYSGKKGGLNVTEACFGHRRHRLQLRWQGDTFASFLEARTRKAYEDNAMIQFSMIEL